jgi:hypothetical protein
LIALLYGHFESSKYPATTPGRRRLRPARKNAAAYLAGVHGISAASDTTARSTVRQLPTAGIRGGRSCGPLPRLRLSTVAL